MVGEGDPTCTTEPDLLQGAVGDGASGLVASDSRAAPSGDGVSLLENTGLGAHFPHSSGMEEADLKAL